VRALKFARSLGPSYLSTLCSPLFAGVYSSLHNSKTTKLDLKAVPSEQRVRLGK
jgi:hypothetical protein